MVAEPLFLCLFCFFQTFVPLQDEFIRYGENHQLVLKT